MQPSRQVWLDFDFSLLRLRAGDVSLNPGPSVRGLRLGTVKARSIRDKASALSDLVTSKGINLLGIAVDQKGNLRMSGRNDPPMVSPFTNLEHDGEGEVRACLCHQLIHFQ